MAHKIKSKLSRMKANAKRMLLLRIYMYAIASGNKHLLSMFKVGKSHKKGRKSRRRGRRHRRKGRRRGKLHGKAKAAFLRRMAAGRRKARR